MKSVNHDKTAARKSTEIPTQKATVTTLSALLTPRSLFGFRKDSYCSVAADFGRFHRHDGNVAAHGVTCCVAVWGFVQFLLLSHEDSEKSKSNLLLLLYSYVVLVGLTVPVPTAVLHTVLVYAMTFFTPSMVLGKLSSFTAFDNVTIPDRQLCIAAAVLGYALQDVAHYLSGEPTYMGSYMLTKRKTEKLTDLEASFKPWLLVIHAIWLLPLVIDAIVIGRNAYTHKIPPRDLLVVTQIASKSAVDELGKWIASNVKGTAETTHVWPHTDESSIPDKCVTTLEHDSAIRAALRLHFDAMHYDIVPVIGMNEMYVTADDTAGKGKITSDAVFHTPHTDGPFWWLPYCSVYRILVGVTPNTKVQTRFTLQHQNRYKIVTQYDVLGFDYNRELHWIGHVADNDSKQPRRALVKLHFLVYPRGWKRYGISVAAAMHTAYNTWARANFLQTLRPSSSLYDKLLAWWIWGCTRTNAILIQHIGYGNLVYVAASYVVGHHIVNAPRLFVVLTSFRHYVLYITTFHFRDPPVALGVLMRDAQVYKMISMAHLANIILWQSMDLDNTRHVAAFLVSLLGFGTTLLATYRLGMVRTYFGCELDFVPPKWIDGFPYGYFPHPMIMGQVFAFGVILAGLAPVLDAWQMGLGLAHIASYLVHMTQEIITGGY